MIWILLSSFNYSHLLHDAADNRSSMAINTKVVYEISFKIFN